MAAASLPINLCVVVYASYYRRNRKVNGNMIYLTNEEIAEFSTEVTPL